MFNVIAWLVGIWLTAQAVRLMLDRKHNKQKD